MLPLPRPSAAAAALLGALALLAALCTTGAEIAEISPTVYVGGVQDLRPDGQGRSKCSRQVDAAMTFRGAAGEPAFSRVQLLLSVVSGGGEW